MLRRLLGWLFGSDSTLGVSQPGAISIDKPLTLDEIKERILTMKSGESKSFPIDHIPEGEEFDSLTGWLAIKKGMVFIGLDYDNMKLDIKLYE